MFPLPETQLGFNIYLQTCELGTVALVSWWKFQDENHKVSMSICLWTSMDIYYGYVMLFYLPIVFSKLICQEVYLLCLLYFGSLLTSCSGSLFAECSPLPSPLTPPTPPQTLSHGVVYFSWYCLYENIHQLSSSCFSPQLDIEGPGKLDLIY